MTNVTVAGQSPFSTPMSRETFGHFTVDSFDVDGIKLITPRVFRDHRGFFVELFRERDMIAMGIRCAFVQDHLSLSSKKGTMRGLHLQLPPYEQGKLVRCGHGRVLDILVDIRIDSPTYGRHVGVELSAENLSWVYVPVGFAHGFYTLEDDSEVFYKVTDYYAPNNDAGILWNDPDLRIDWPLDGEPILSDKDVVLPRLKEFNSPFTLANSAAADIKKRVP